MADAIARRREARRRKLLMSSEDRLNKILQLKVQTKDNEETNCENAESIISKCPRVTTQTDQGIASNQTDTTRPVYQTTNNDIILGKEVSNKPLFSEERSVGSSTDEETLTSSRNSSGDAKFLDEQNLLGLGQQSNCSVTNPAQNNLRTSIQTHFLKEEGNSTTILNRKKLPQSGLLNNDSESVTRTLGPIHGTELSHPTTQDQSTATLTQNTEVKNQQKSNIGHLVSMRQIGCIFLAITIRWMWTCDWLTDYTGQSIMVPFFALQMLIAMLTSNQSKAEGGFLMRSLSMMLMLSRIPPVTITKVTNILAVFYAVCTDLTLYLFAFIVSHCVLEVFG